MHKDNFSGHSEDYSRFRPKYPAEAYEYILSLVASTDRCWDCATGNGQVAAALSTYFTDVFATDISANQIRHAERFPNIHYSVQSAEDTNFEDGIFDLVTVGQAIHWFNFDSFYTEVQRTSNSGGVMVVMGYGLHSVDSQTDELVHHLYEEILGPYWDEERKYIEEEYRTIPFPFKELATPEIEMRYAWSFEEFIGYLNTWSALKHYINEHGVNPLAEIQSKLSKLWTGVSSKTVRFPLLLRTGRIHS